ncbi:hypothetical protein NB700_001888 [Xanthomonas sacchari]|uniref:Uncharacterized protein n=1 Tax=Xanthomonas sacchari TaxID=56458 RepID=A0ABT3DV25_9XANT|nr:hypothetical protein [Xanthomonas sacchari]MCW0399332.1 hypothetical protein [Xanthomonas sacchari]
MSIADNAAKRLTVRDLQQLLADCDPDAIVSLCLPAFIAESDKTVTGDPDILMDGYSDQFPDVVPSFRTSKETPYEHFFDETGQPRPGVSPNCVTIGLTNDDTEALFAARRRAIERDATDEEDLGIEPEPAVADAENVVVDVRLPRELHTTIRRLLGRMNASHRVKAEQACTHGLLTVAGMLEMLAQDAGMVESRPGSWEGSNMAQVFASHGYN